jgi:hypothetical protein
VIESDWLGLTEEWQALCPRWELLRSFFALLRAAETTEIIAMDAPLNSIQRILRLCAKSVASRAGQSTTAKGT